MNDQSCLIQDCQGKVYAPAGTKSVCKGHFLNFLTWRRRKGAAMFSKYAGMTMGARDGVAEDWQKTVHIE